MIAGKFWNGPQLVNVKGILVRKFQLDPRWEIRTDVWLEIASWIPAGASGRAFAWELLKGIPLGSSERVFVVKWEGGAISEADGVKLGESVKWGGDGIRGWRPA